MTGEPASPSHASAQRVEPGAQTRTCRRYAGVDLAADPARTGIAVIREEPGRVVVERVDLGATDDDVLAVVRDAHRAGIDVPFGWPSPFVDYICAQATGQVTAPPSTDPAWRRSMAQRTTDLHVRSRTGLIPLSVSTDRIAYPALRWAALESRLLDAGLDVPRDGSGRACEVYPAAALARWGLPHRGYKGSKNAIHRHNLVTRLVKHLPWFEWSGHESMCRADDNVLDAVVAALVAREVDLGSCEPSPPELASVVAREGWVWLPTDTPTAPRAHP